MAQRRLRVALWLFALLLAAAWQVTPAFANTITVNTTTDEFGAGAGCSLREAIKAANDNSTFGGCSAGAGADNIEIPAGTYTITIAGTGEDSNATGDWDIAESATLVGAGQGSTILDGGSLDRVIQAFGITDVTLVLRDLTIQNGLGAINVDTGMSSGTSTTLTRVTVRNNTGSGINSGNDLIVTDSTFVGNSGGSAIVPTRDVSISGSTFSGNSAAEGAVLWADGQGYTITSSTFSGNSATTSGGVFRVGGGSATP